MVFATRTAEDFSFSGLVRHFSGKDVNDGLENVRPLVKSSESQKKRPICRENTPNRKKNVRFLAKSSE